MSRHLANSTFSIVDYISYPNPIEYVSFEPGWLREIYLDGTANAETGHEDAPIGHNYRVGSYVVTTDSLGFSVTYRYETTRHAERAFAYAENQYAEWLDLCDEMN